MSANKNKYMKAVKIYAHGGVDVLQYEEKVPVPEVKEDEILVRVHSAGVSPFDTRVRNGLNDVAEYPMPCILGWECSGDVVAVGRNISLFKINDAVFGMPDLKRGGGCYAEYVLMKENELTLKPESLGYNEAAAASLNGLISWQSLFDVAHLTAGQRVLIHAGAGGVGHIAVQLAKLKGAYVISTASEKNKPFLLDLGADEVIDYSKGPFENKVKDLDVVLDLIGGDTLMRSFSVLKKGGMAVSIIDFEKIQEAPKFDVKGENAIVHVNARELAKIAELLNEQKLKVEVAEVFSLKEIAKAHALCESHHARGKIIIKM